jgi:hypothetical protein
VLEQFDKLRRAFTEFVRGEARRFKLDVAVEADSESDATKEAIDHFDELARESQVGWIRRINGVDLPSRNVHEQGQYAHQQGKTAPRTGKFRPRTGNAVV